MAAQSRADRPAGKAMPETTATLLNLRIDGRARAFDPARPVSLGAHRYCNAVLPSGEGNVPLRAAIFEWKNGAWLLSNTSTRPILLQAEGDAAMSLPPGGSVALAGKPFVLTVGGAPAASVEVSTQATGTENPPWEPHAAGRADLALMSPWAGESVSAPRQALVPAPAPAVAWVPGPLPPPVPCQRILLPPPPGVWGYAGPTRTTTNARARGTVTALVVAILLVASAAGAAGWSRSRAPGAPPRPAQWDPRLGDIVSFVENERGLSFRHPVFVDYLPDEAFRQTLVGDPGEVSETERQSMEQTIGFFRAIGLIEGNPDLFSGSDQVSGDGTLAYYDPDTERVRVRGTELTEAVKATLAHELTHALQDQHFNLSRVGDHGDTVDRFRAVVEGDAMRVERKWVDHLATAALKAHDAGRASEVQGADFSAVPEVLTSLFSAPYDLGEPFVEILHAVGGNPAVDRVLKSPPASEEQLLDPFRYVAGDTPLQVNEPAVQKGETRLDSGDFGAYGLYLMLAQRLSAREALAAVDGWGGDSYVHVLHEGRSCVRADFVGDNRQETDQLAGTLEAWARAMHAGAASVARHDTAVELNSCDPGPGAKIGGPRLSDAVNWPLARTYTALGAIQAGAPQDVATCYSRELIAAFTPEQLIGTPTAAQERQMGKLAAGCKQNR